MSALSWMFVAHYLGDFPLQVFLGWEEKKSSSWVVLGKHVLAYTAVLAVFCLPLGIPVGYAVANGSIHLLVDAVTSRLSSKAYKAKRIPLFWSIIGADQLLHALCLVELMP